MLLKYYFIIALLFSNSFCFAGWRDISLDTRNTQKNMTREELDAYLREYNKEFVVNEDSFSPSKIGVRIFAMEQSITSLVTLRFDKNKIDFRINLFQPLFNGSGTIYLQLLDEDRFLIKSIFVSRVCDGYSGTLLGNYDMNWENFQKIKYYEISMRS